MSLAGVEQTARSSETKLAVELVVLKMLERPPLSEMVAVSQAIARLEMLAKGKKPNFDILSAPTSATQISTKPAPAPVVAPSPAANSPVRESKPAVPKPVEVEPEERHEEPVLASPAAAKPHIEAKGPQRASVSQEDEAVEELPDEEELVDMNSLMLESMPLEDVDERWINFIAEIALKERKLASHLEHAYFTSESSLTEGKMCLVFKKKLHHSNLESFQGTDYFRDIFCKHFGTSLNLEAAYEPDFDAEVGPSVHKARRHALEKAHAALRTHAEENPVVKKALSLFGGEIKSVERLS